MAQNTEEGGFSEFLDDYFSECDEHLAAAKRGVLALEPFLGQPQIPREWLDELFRNFHSIKGLSAMVGGGPAEQLAHQFESYLSALRGGAARLDAEGLDTLIAGLKTLEEAVSARRGQTPPPVIDALLARIGALSASPTAVPPSAPSDAEETRVWRFTFLPSPVLAERGINVNSVRERLQGIGAIIQATPEVRDHGQIAFSFQVRSAAPESAFAAWRSDGLGYAPADPEPAASTPPSNQIRVDMARLDELMRQVGELVVSRARLDDNLQRLKATVSGSQWRALHETGLTLERQLRDLRAAVMRVRMVPMRDSFARMRFMVRDLAREAGKNVAMEQSGAATEIDKFIVERLFDALLHLVRNAVSHGLEAPAERIVAGKPAQARLTLRASTVGETVVIEVEDDGRGIDADKVFARARACGLLAADAPTDAAALLDVLCTPSFSTRNQADRVSGRGVGLDVARRAVEELGGTLAFRSELGKGSCFTLQVPLTLAIADALIVSVAGMRYAVPQAAVREVIQIDAAALTRSQNNELLAYHGGALPILRLARFFGAEGGSGGAYALVTGAGTAMVGLAVDRVLGLREVVVRPLTDKLVQAPGIMGATELGDNQVVLILDTVSLARAMRRHEVNYSLSPPELSHGR